MQTHSLFLYSIWDEKIQSIGGLLPLKKLVKSDLNLLHEPFM